MAKVMGFSMFLMLWLASRASADGGDDFANNLASDLGPIIALFGERVVMQFMSQAMGIADCVLLAVAPIGAITTVVSAIRVAGPAWLKSFIGRARENLAAAEIEVMSSTSKEACELWNGSSVVRCPGSAGIYQFICLFPEGKFGRSDGKPLSSDDIEAVSDTLSGTQTKVDFMTLKMAKEVTEHGPPILREIPTAGPAYVQKCLKEGLSNLCVWPRKKKSDEEEGVRLKQAEQNTSQMSDDSAINQVSNNSNRRDTITVIVDDSEDNTPNLLLNCHDRVGRREIYAAAALGILLQVGVLVYFGFITYYRPIQDRFLKDGKRAVKYAFPCAAAGTVLLVFGLFICAWVVEMSTTETCYEAIQHRMFVVWLQKQHTLSDQVFKSFAIYPWSKRDYITLSRRNKKQTKQKLEDYFRDLKQLWSPDKTTKDDKKDDQSFETQNSEIKRSKASKPENSDASTSGTQNSEDKKTLDWPLELITVFGAFISLVGFISQFIGMRGLNWTASIVQLAITFVVTILRVVVRRGLGKSPIRTVLTSKYEIDWFALSFGHLFHAPWATLEKVTNSDAHENDASEDKNITPKWSVRTGGEREYPALRRIRSGDSSQDEDKSMTHKMLRVRQKLGEISNWKSPVNEEAARLSAAIEAVADTFLKEVFQGEGETLLWTIPATYGNKDEDFYIKLQRKGPNAKWEVEGDMIDAMLSLWLYSAPSARRSDINEPHQLRVYGSNRLKEQLHRDLRWWKPEIIFETTEYTKENLESLKNDQPEWTVVGFTSELRNDTETINVSGHQGEEFGKYLALECQEKPERLFSRDLLFSFIRAVAKMPEFTMSSASSVHQMKYNRMSKGWKELKIKNDIISKLAIELEKIGFGTLTDIYLDLIMLLSLEQKLTNIKNVIAKATEQAQEHEKSFQWKKLVNICCCLLDLATQFDLEKESSGPLALAVSLEFLGRLRNEAQLQTWESRTEAELAAQLEVLENHLNNDIFQKSTFFHWPMDLPLTRGNCAMAFRVLISTTEQAGKFPESFQVTSKHLEAILARQLGYSVYFWDFEKLEMPDAFGWSPLHYAANAGTKDIYIDTSQKDEALNIRDFMGWTPLHHACLNDNVEVINSLLKRGAPVEIAGSDGVTPLHCVARSGNAAILQELMERIDLRSQSHTRKNKSYLDCNERHPIHWASVEGNTNIVQLLKDDISIADRFGWTCLHIAVIYQHKKLINYLIEDCVINIDMVDNDSRTPLHLAVETGSLAVVQTLIAAHANVNIKMKDGSTPLHMAVKQKEIVQVLLKHSASIEEIDNEGRTSLYLALADGEIDVATLLLETGEKVAAMAAKDGRTPLHMALSLGDDGFDIAARLIQIDGNASHNNDYCKVKSKDGATPLHVAAEYGPLKAVKMLLDIGANIDATDEFGQTPLLNTIYQGKWEIANLLITAGANVKADNRHGYTPLLGAVLGGNDDIVKLLLEAKVDINSADEDGYSPLHLAVSQDNDTIFRQLLEAGASIDAVAVLNKQTPLHIAVIRGNRMMIGILLTRGANTRLFDHLDFSPLQYALYLGNLGAVEEFVDYDKQSNTRKPTLEQDEYGNTPLHTLCEWTARKGEEQTMCKILDKLLSVAKANINTKNDAGLTPLDMAYSRAGEFREFLAMLIANGAQPSEIQDGSGSSL